MKLLMHRALWNSLGLDEPRRYRLALCAFYLGKGVEETRDLMTRSDNDPELDYVISTAAFCGLNENKDYIRKV